MFTHKAAHKNRRPGEIRATQDGAAIPLADVPDTIIREGYLGEGVAIIPSKERVVSPVDGVITSIADSKHAFCIQTSDGVEALVHIGVDTVKLKGEGFRVHVEEGAYVHAGTHLCDVDLALLAERGFAAHTAVLITNPEDFRDITPVLGDVKEESSVIIRYGPKAGTA